MSTHPLRSFKVEVSDEGAHFNTSVVIGSLFEPVRKSSSDTILLNRYILSQSLKKKQKHKKNTKRKIGV